MAGKRVKKKEKKKKRKEKKRKKKHKNNLAYNIRTETIVKRTSESNQAHSSIMVQVAEETVIFTILSHATASLA